MSVNKHALMQWMMDLFPINRSLSGDGNRATLRYLKSIVPSLEIKEIKSGQNVGDWLVPDEWNVQDAYIECPDGRRFAQFRKNNLHLVGYSHPINRVVDKSELIEHLHYLPDAPNSVPYITSYYSRNWGFCITKNEFDTLGQGPFRVFIDSSFKTRQEGGVLNYGEIFFPGESTQEVIFSTYICHPSMANNELSGPVITTALAQFVEKINNHYSFRFLFLPETIGAIYYLNNNLERLKRNLIAGWVITCTGDSGRFSYIPSRMGNNYADKLTIKLLEKTKPGFRKYSWLDRGSDERQFCSPGVDLPFCSVTRSKYGAYPEYHTSADNLEFVSAKSLYESFSFYVDLISLIEANRAPRMKIFGEPQMGKRGLYPNISSKFSNTDNVINLMNTISYFDGMHSLEEIAIICNLDLNAVVEITELMRDHNLIEI